MDESIRQWAAGRGRLVMRCLQLALVICLAVLVAQAASAQGEPEQSPTTRINPTGRVLIMPVPLMDGTRQLGELVARIGPDDTIWVRKKKLIRLLGDRLKPEVLAAIRNLPEKGKQVAISSLAPTGAKLRFDQGDVALKFVPKVDLRSSQDLNVGGFSSRVSSARQAKAAGVSGYLNVFTGAEHVWASENQPGQSGLHFDVETALRAGGVVLQAEGAYEGVIDTRTCPREAVCNYEHQSGFKRRTTRIVHDRPEQALRFQAGDAKTRTAGFQRSTDILGVAVERSPRKLQPDTAGRSSSAHTILVEKPSQAEISLNGTVIRRVRLQPGNYDLKGLALVTGSNDIEVTLIDDSGARRKISQSTYFDRRLLAPADTEWALSGGVLSYYRDGERRYLEDGYAGSGYYRWGISDRLTGEVNGQADQDVQLAGASLLAATSWGFFTARSAISLSDVGPGIGIGADWDLINAAFLHGLFGYGEEDDGGAQRQSLRFSAEYLTEHFRVPGNGLTNASGLVYPTHDYWLKLSASYTTPLAYGVSATLAGRYKFGRERATDALGMQYGDLFGADLTFSGALSDRINGSLTFGYSNESYRFTQSGEARTGEFRLMARAFMRLGNRTHVSATHDTLNQQSILTGYHSSGDGVGRWETTVDSYDDGWTDQSSAGGSLTYYGNRAEVRVAHNSSLADVDWSSFSMQPGQQRTSVRLGSSIAFADGKVAIGAPIRGGFAIVYPHESLKDKKVTVGSPNDVRAYADGWGAAVVPNLPAYSETTLVVDVDDLPLGYSLGAGSFDLRSPFRGGYALMVGSGRSVSAYGTLVDAAGAPLALLSGVAFPASDRTLEVGVITNSSGRFAAEGLSPGAWHIEMSSGDGTITYTLVVPEGTDGLLRTGTLRPTGGTIAASSKAAPDLSPFRTVVASSASTSDTPATRALEGLRGSK